LEQLKETFNKHFEMTTIIITITYYFYPCNQAEDEATANNVAELRHLSAKCDFGDNLEQALQDKLVWGL